MIFLCEFWFPLIIFKTVWQNGTKLYTHVIGHESSVPFDICQIPTTVWAFLKTFKRFFTVFRCFSACMSISSKRFDGSSWNFANVFLLMNGRHLRSFVATRNAALPPSGHFWNYFTVLLRSCPYLWNALTDLHEILHMCFYQWVDDTHKVLLEPGILLCHLVAIFETILRFFCIHVHTFEMLWWIFMKFYTRYWS